MCGMCEAHINDAVRKHFDVRSAKSNRRKGTCVVVSDAELDRRELKSVIADAGYGLTSVKSEPYRRKGLFGLR